MHPCWLLPHIRCSSLHHSWLSATADCLGIWPQGRRKDNFFSGGPGEWIGQIIKGPLLAANHKGTSDIEGVVQPAGAILDVPQSSFSQTQENDGNAQKIRIPVFSPPELLSSLRTDVLPACAKHTNRSLNLMQTLPILLNDSEKYEYEHPLGRTKIRHQLIPCRIPIPTSSLSLRKRA